MNPEAPHPNTVEAEKHPDYGSEIREKQEALMQAVRDLDMNKAAALTAEIQAFNGEEGRMYAEAEAENARFDIEKAQGERRAAIEQEQTALLQRISSGTLSPDELAAAVAEGKKRIEALEHGDAEPVTAPESHEETEEEGLERIKSMFAEREATGEIMGELHAKFDDEDAKLAKRQSAGQVIPGKKDPWFSSEEHDQATIARRDFSQRTGEFDNRYIHEREEFMKTDLKLRDSVQAAQDSVRADKDLIASKRREILARPENEVVAKFLSGELLKDTK